MSKKKRAPALPRWSAEELNALRLLYGTVPLQELQKKHLPGRTMKAIAVKAAKMGLTHGGAAAPWTKAELELMALHRNMPVHELRDTYFPDRTVGAVANKRAAARSASGQDGTDKTAGRPAATRKPWTREETELLERLYDTMPAKELQARYFPDRTARAITQKAYLMATLDTRAPTWTDEELRVLKDNIGKVPVSHMAGTLLPNRSRTAIETKLTLLGLRPGKTGKTGT